MVIVKLNGFPAQPFAVGVTVTVPIVGEFVVFCPAKTGTVPFPDEIKPIEGFELVHENVVPVTVEPGLTTVELAPEQID